MLDTQVLDSRSANAIRQHVQPDVRARCYRTIEFYTERYFPTLLVEIASMVLAVILALDSNCSHENVGNDNLV
jgi:hypothetical protein